MYPETKEEYLDKWVKVGRLYWKSPNDVIKIFRRTKHYITYQPGYLERNENDDWEFKLKYGTLNYIVRKMKFHEGNIIVDNGDIEIWGSFDNDASCFYCEFPN